MLGSLFNEQFSQMDWINMLHMRVNVTLTEPHCCFIVITLKKKILKQITIVMSNWCWTVAGNNITVYMIPTCDFPFIIMNITFVVLNCYIRHPKMSIEAHFQIDRLRVFPQRWNSSWLEAGVWEAGMDYYFWISIFDILFSSDK